VRASAESAATTRPSAAETPDYPFTLWCVMVTCGLMPLYIVRWHYGPLPTTLLETGILVTIAAFVVESWRHHVVPEWRTPYTLPAALFIVAGLIAFAAMVFSVWGMARRVARTSEPRAGPDGNRDDRALDGSARSVPLQAAADGKGIQGVSSHAA